MSNALTTPVALDVVLAAGAVISTDISVVVGIGITFYQSINGQLYEFARGNAMKVAVTG